MNIMLITQLPPPSGGIASWSKKYVAYCAENGISISVVNNAMIGNRGKDFHAKRSLVTELKRTFRIVNEICKRKKEHHPEVVHFNTACSPSGLVRDYLCMLVIGKKIPVVLHCRCTVQDQLDDNRIGIFFFKKIVEKSNQILVLNDLSATYVHKLTGKIPIKIANFVSESTIRKEQKPISDSINRIIYTGHVQQAKGIDEIIKVAESLPDIEFLLVGQVKDEYTKIAVPDNIFMTGNQTADKVEEFLDSSDVFLFPSYTEGFANSLAEAMARGLPIIASEVGANQDMIEDKGGIIVPVKNPEAIANAIKKIEPKDFRRRMSSWNIQKVQNEYTISKVMQKLLDIYANTAQSS